MERYEMAELLSRKAHISLEEARAALEENDWDMLDAMVWIERQGKAADPTVTVGGDAQDGGAELPQPVKNTAGGKERDYGFKAGIKKLWYYIKRAFRATVENDFVIIRRDKRLLSMPVLVLIVLFFCAFWAVLIALIIGLFCGCSYRFEGRMAAANPAMEKIENAVDKVKDGIVHIERDDDDGEGE